jgi:glutathione S-transferase
MNLTFYRAPMSTASVTELVLEELEVPHEVITLNLKGGETRTPKFRELNPNAKVPVLVHDGTSIWESSAITMYLGEIFGVEKKLWPAAGPARGEAMKWVAWSNVTLAEAIIRLLRNTKDWYPAEQRNERAGEAAREDLDRCLRVLDEALGRRPYVCGGYSLVDAHLSSFVEWLRHSGVDLSTYANIAAWDQRCSARPARKRLEERQRSQGEAAE